MALTKPKLHHSTWRMIRPSTAVFIMLSVSIMVESRRCYWCGPLAEQVHRSRRATPCDSPEDHVTTCEPGLAHCALVATSPPYVESRLCVKIYQDECYPLFCNSTKTWKMTCPCRGDLCNGFSTERENEAFAYLSKLVKKNSRIKRAAATPKYINRNEKMVINDENDEDNNQIRDIDGNSDKIVMPTSDYVLPVTNINNIQNEEVSAENSEQPSSMNAIDISKNDDKIEISENDKINMNDAEVYKPTDSSNTNKEDDVSDMDIQSDEPAKSVEENDNVKLISNSVPKTNNTEEMKEARNMDTASLVTNDKADAVSVIDVQSDDPGKSPEEHENVVLSSESSSPKTDSSEEEMKEARSMETDSLVTISQEMLESKHVTEAATMPVVVIEKPLLSDESNLKPSGEPPTAEALSQNFSPTEQGKMENMSEKKTEMPPQKAIPTEKTPVVTLEHTSSTVNTFAEVTTKPNKTKKNHAVMLCTYINNYILSWITLYFFI